MTPKFLALVENGKPKLKEPDQFRQYCSHYEGKQVFVIVEKARKIRSEKSHRYYWAYLQLVSDEYGDDPNSIHEICKRKFLPPQIVKVRGKEYKLPATTTTLSTREFSEYLDRIAGWCGVPLPDPSQFYGG